MTSHTVFHKNCYYEIHSIMSSSLLPTLYLYYNNFISVCQLIFYLVVLFNFLMLFNFILTLYIFNISLSTTFLNIFYFFLNIPA
nr:MAG TPA: hypothetical protein [Caudoviricetes sp.]